MNHRYPISAALADPAVTRVTPFAVFIAFIALSPLVSESARPDLAGDVRWVTVLRAGVVAFILAWFWRGYEDLRVPEGFDPRHWLLAIASGLAVFVVWIHFDDGWAVFGHTPGFDPTEGGGRIDLPLAVLRFIGLALVVPVMEELFWRSFLLRWLDSRDFLTAEPRRVSFRAFALTAVLFASEHSLWFAGLIAGMTYNWVYARTGSLWMPIISHATTNGALGIWIFATRSWHLW